MRFRDWLEIQERKKDVKPDYSVDNLLKGVEDLEKDLRSQIQDSRNKEDDLNKEIDKKKREKKEKPEPPETPIEPKPWDKGKNKPGDKTKPWERDKKRMQHWDEPKEDDPPWPKQNQGDDHGGRDGSGHKDSEEDNP